MIRAADDFGTPNWDQLGTKQYTILGVAVVFIFLVAFTIFRNRDRYTTTAGLIGVVLVAAGAFWLTYLQTKDDSPRTKELQAQVDATRKQVDAGQKRLDAAQDQVENCDRRIDTVYELAQTKLRLVSEASAAHDIANQMIQIMEREGCGIRGD